MKQHLPFAHAHAGLTTLQCLKLDGANGIHGTNLAPLTSLTHLKLGHAPLDERLLEHITALRGLQHLDLSLDSSPISDGLTAVSALTAMTNLSLCGRRLSATIVQSIARLSHLQALDISYGGVNGASAAPLAALTGLTSLKCNCNALGAVGARHIGKCTRLQRLQVASTALEDEGMAELQCLTALRYLDAANNRFTAAGACCIADSLSRLTWLVIPGNDVGDAGVIHLASLPELAHLEMSHEEALTAPGLRSLASMKERGVQINTGLYWD